jgi:hypothetical protein
MLDKPRAFTSRQQLHARLLVVFEIVRDADTFPTCVIPRRYGKYSTIMIGLRLDKTPIIVVCQAGSCAVFAYRRKGIVFIVGAREVQIYWRKSGDGFDTLRR